MELIAYDTSRITTLFIASSLIGHPYLPRASQLLVERYKFAAFPIRIEDLSGEKIVFTHGLFGDSAIESLNVYSDGIVVSSRANTDILDAFIDDLVGWLDANLNLKRVETHDVNKVYESNVMVHSGSNLLFPLDVIAVVADAITSALRSTTKIEAPYKPFGIAMAADHSLIPGLKPTSFRLERKLGLAFDMNYYISSAPLPTNEHLKVLQKLEGLSR